MIKYQLYKKKIDSKISSNDLLLNCIKFIDLKFDLKCKFKIGFNF